jgi:hypothetical protein
VFPSLGEMAVVSCASGDSGELPLPVSEFDMEDMDFDMASHIRKRTLHVGHIALVTCTASLPSVLTY